MIEKNFNIYVGSSTGSVKGVTVGQNRFGTRSIYQNLIKNKSELSNKNGVTCMEWCDGNQELLISFKNKVKLMTADNNEFVSEIISGNDTICGVFKKNDVIYAALSSGVVETTKLIDPHVSWVEYMKMNGTIERMKRSFIKNNIIATGGQNNDLKLWNFEAKEKIFDAKNIKPDELQIQAPIWISDILFSRVDERVSTCSRHGYVRTYDPRLSQRRPTFNAHQPESVFTCLSGTPNDKQLLVGNGTGEIYLVDTRAKTPFLSKFKGSCGAIKGISCPFDNNLVFSVSLDRHFRIHDFKTRKLLFKDYMMSRLTTVITKAPFIIEKFEEKVKIEDYEENEATAKMSKSEKKALNKLFKCMETVEEVDPKSKILTISKKIVETPQKKCITITKKKLQKSNDAEGLDYDSDLSLNSDDSAVEASVPVKKIKWKNGI